MHMNRITPTVRGGGCRICIGRMRRLPRSWSNTCATATTATPRASTTPRGSTARPTRPSSATSCGPSRRGRRWRSPSRWSFPATRRMTFCSPPGSPCRRPSWRTWCSRPVSTPASTTSTASTGSWRPTARGLSCSRRGEDVSSRKTFRASCRRVRQTAGRCGRLRAVAGCGAVKWLIVQ